MAHLKRLSPLEAILSAQNGISTAYFPTYAEALVEIRRGAKRSCWMWYIWPSLIKMRKTKYPSFQLSGLDEAMEYLRHGTLGPRLRYITAVATEKLESGISGRALFGISVDSEKFHETCTVFGIVALLVDGDKIGSAVFVAALRAYGGLNAKAVEIILEEEDSEVKIRPVIVRLDQLIDEMSQRDGLSRTKSELIKRSEKGDTIKKRPSSLDAILSAQDGLSAAYFPTYAEALAEIRRGAKRSCWMWYIWPSLIKMRKTKYLSFQISGIDEAMEYLRHGTLGPRLRYITAVATEKLESGISGRALFGKDVDSEKFHETCTVFGIVALLVNRENRDSTVFVAALRAYGGLNLKAVELILKEEDSEVKIRPVIVRLGQLIDETPKRDDVSWKKKISMSMRILKRKKVKKGCTNARS